MRATLCYSQLQLILWGLLSLFSLCNAGFFPNVYPKLHFNAKPSRDAGNPLMLTPYLKKGSIELAQNLSRVSLTSKMGFVSHAGFFTIDETYNSNLYFWYFPPFSKNASAPVILWLQGGPGGTSLYGLFAELGPLTVRKRDFAVRKYHWALNSHLIFIDNPVGTGFSFTDNDAGYCNDQPCIGQGLYNALQQFFTLFPNLRNNEFYITGESYAGKYIPSLGMVIHNENANSIDKKINLKGMAMGNAYCDPINQLNYGKYLYQHGLLDDNQLKIFETYENEVHNQIEKEHWAEADMIMDRLMDGEVANFSYFKSFTGFTNYYNFLYAQDEDDHSAFAALLQNDIVRRSVHVGGLPFNDGQTVQLHLALDMMKSVAAYITELLSHYRILFYNGQLDIVVAYPLTEKFLRNLRFSGSEEYITAPREIWLVDDDVAGYIKKAGNMTEVLVRNAGHMVPKDQPKAALDLITRFVNNNVS